MNGSEEVFQNTRKNAISKSLEIHSVTTRGRCANLPLWSYGNVRIHLTHTPEGLFGLGNIPRWYIPHHMVALHGFQHRKKSFGVLNLHHLEMLKVQKITIFSEWLSTKKVFYNRYFQQYFHPPRGGATLICQLSDTEMFRNTQCILL